MQEELSTSYLQTTTSIAESGKSDQNKNGAVQLPSNGQARSQDSKEAAHKKHVQEMKDWNSREERIQQEVFKSRDLAKDSVEHLGETPLYGTIDLQTDDSDNRSDSKSSSKR